MQFPSTTFNQKRHHLLKKIVIYGLNSFIFLASTMAEIATQLNPKLTTPYIRLVF